MTDQIELTLTPHDYAVAHILHRWIRPLMRPKSWIYLALALGVGILWLKSLEQKMPTALTLALVILILIPIWFAKEYLFVFWHFRKIRKIKSQISLDKSGLRYRYGDVDRLYPWTELRGLSQIRSYLFLKLDRRRFLLLSSKGFSSNSQYQLWIETLKQNIKT